MKKIARLTAFVFALLIFSSTFIVFANAAVVPYTNPMLDTYVKDDLRSLKINPDNYALDTSATHVRDLYFLEYGFNKGADQRYYGLYLYLYNPCGKQIESAYVEMSYIKRDGADSGVVKYPVEILSYSIDTNDEHLLYKLKLEGTESFVRNISDTRTYKLNSIEISYKDKSEPVSYALGSKWTYTGLQYNFGSGSPKGTLYCEYTNNDVVNVELHPVSWLSNTADIGDDYRWEIKSYYFAIPNDIIEKYGNITEMDFSDTDGLVGVKGQYYKYGLNGLIVPDQVTYDAFKSSVNKHNLVYGNDVYNRDDWGSFVGDFNVGLTLKRSGDFSFNVEKDLILKNQFETDFNLSKYNLLSQSSENGFTISNKELTDLWISAGKPLIYDPTQLYSGSHMSSIGNRVDIDINVDTAKSLTEGLKTDVSDRDLDNAGFLTRLFKGILFDFQVSLPECLPLIQIHSGDVSEVQEEYYSGTKLLIDYEGFCDLQNFYKEKGLKNNVYLMRLDVDPLYCSEVDLFSNPQLKDRLGTGYYYEKTIHKDVDIFSFIFRDKGENFVTVPVNCKPATNVGSVAPGNDYDEPNPNRYPDNPSAPELVRDWIKALLDFLGTLKGIAILVGSAVLVIGLLVILIVFWKQLQPFLRGSGKALGKVGGAIGKIFKFIFEFIGDCLLLIHNIGANVLFFFFKIDLRVSKKLDFGFGSKTEPIDRDARADRKWELEERERKRKNEEEDREHKKNKDNYMREVYEEERKQKRERHEKDMKSSISSRSSKPDYTKEKKALQKAIAEDRAARDRRLGRGSSEHDNFDVEEFFQAAVNRSYDAEDFFNASVENSLNNLDKK